MTDPLGPADQVPARRGPPPPAPYIRMAGVPAWGKLVVQCLNRRPRHLWTHWHNGREHVCCIEDGRCWCCAERSRPRWSGFLGACLYQQSGTWVVRISEGGANHCPGQPFHEPGPDLRGLWLELKRTVAKPNGPVAIRTAPPRAPIDDLPPPVDLDGYLCRLFGLAKLPGMPEQRPCHRDPGDADF